jgi:transcriptional regulator with XRE-family HTH domain
MHMLAVQYGRIIRDKRLEIGLKQEELAERARVSRAVVSELECGKRKAVQSDTVERLFRALGVQPQVLQRADRDGPRKLARLQQELKLRDQRERHLRLAFDLAQDEHAAAESVAKARDRVELWRQKKSCSQFYIDRWSELLALSPRQLAKEMHRLGDWESALFQNSPWSWAWT